MATKKEPEKHSKTSSPTRVVLYMPEEMHRAFKAKCAMEGRNMQDVTYDLVSAYVKDGKRSEA